MLVMQNGESVKVLLYSSGSRSDAIADVLLPSARHDVMTLPIYAVLSRWHYTCNYHSISHATCQCTHSPGLCCALQVNRWVLAGVALFVFADD